MKAFVAVVLLLVGTLVASAAPTTYSITGNFKGLPIVVTTSTRNAGAVDALTYNGINFVNSFDHGRELQSALFLQGYGECYNPTEAGSNADGFGDTTTSSLLSQTIGTNSLTNRTQMAWWLAPGVTDSSCVFGPGPYTTPLSPLVLSKSIQIGIPAAANAIFFHLGVDTAKIIGTSSLEFTGYMPTSYSVFYTFDQTTGLLSMAPTQPSSTVVTSGEQTKPVVLSKTDNSSALGIKCTGLPNPNDPNRGYGLYAFPVSLYPGSNTYGTAAAVKWSAYFRSTSQQQALNGFDCYVLVGSLEDVRVGLISVGSVK